MKTSTAFSHGARWAAACSLTLALSSASSAQCDPWEALGGGQVYLKGRYRYELVDDDSPSRPDPGYASTLRTVLGYETGMFHDFNAGVEFENITVIGNELYDSGLNGMTTRGFVADAETTEVNQAWVGYGGVENLGVKLGRQVVTLGNHRFVGDVGWRQNQQTYDGVRVNYDPTDTVGIDALYIENVNRVFGDESVNGDFQMNSLVVQADVDVDSIASISLFGLLLDSDSDVPALSTTTFGVRGSGKQSWDGIDLLYDASVALQSDTGDNPSNVDEEYLAAEVGVGFGGDETKTAVKLGWERLGGSTTAGDGSFQTPLATLHKFNGWADQFLGTPMEGLEDLYVNVGGKAAGFSWAAVWHDFTSAAGSIDYGTEIDAVVTRRIDDHTSAGVKVALYDADMHNSDVAKYWFWLAFGI